MHLKLALLFVVCYFPAFSQTEIYDNNIEDKILLEDERLVVLDFYATWCGPCKLMDPILSELSKKYSGTVDFYKLDVDKNETDDFLGIESIPTYLFLRNGETLDIAEGAMSKEAFEAILIKHRGRANTVAAEKVDPNASEFDEAATRPIWNDWSKLNTLAWHAYEEHNLVDELLKAIEIVKRSISLDENYHNLDTYAALLYKTGRYEAAIKKAKEAIEVAKRDEVDYTATTELILLILDKI